MTEIFLLFYFLSFSSSTPINNQPKDYREITTLLLPFEIEEAGNGEPEYHFLEVDPQTFEREQEYMDNEKHLKKLKDLVWLEPLPGDVGYDSKYPELRKKADTEEIFYDEDSAPSEAEQLPDISFRKSPAFTHQRTTKKRTVSRNSLPLTSIKTKKELEFEMMPRGNSLENQLYRARKLRSRQH